MLYINFSNGHHLCNLTTCMTFFHCSFPVIPYPDDCYDSSDDDINYETSVLISEQDCVDDCKEAGPLIVYPLYSMLPPEKQAEVKYS